MRVCVRACVCVRVRVCVCVFLLFSFLKPIPPCPLKEASNAEALSLVTGEIVTRLAAAVKPVLVAGVNLRKHAASDAFMRLVDASGYAFACMPNAKGMVSEQHPSYIGTVSACVRACDFLSFPFLFPLFPFPSLCFAFFVHVLTPPPVLGPSLEPLLLRGG